MFRRDIEFFLVPDDFLEQEPGSLKSPTWTEGPHSISSPPHRPPQRPLPGIDEVRRNRGQTPRPFRS